LAEVAVVVCYFNHCHAF